jgi:hypothetical protein
MRERDKIIVGIRSSPVPTVLGNIFPTVVTMAWYNGIPTLRSSGYVVFFLLNA